MFHRILRCVGVIVLTAVAAGFSFGQTTFTNPSSISIPDQGQSDNLYPSPIVVSGLGNVTDVNVTLNGLTHTFPDDVALMLVSPSGAKMVIQSDVGGGTDVTARTYTLDDQAASGIPDGGPMPANGGSARPSSVGDDEFFPAPAPVDCQPAGECPQAAPAGSATLNGTFGGTPANGTWNLYVIDCCAGDFGAFNGGWSITITATPGVAADAPVDFNGDGRTDYAVVRNIGGGPSGALRWFYNLNNSANPTVGFDWGVGIDFPISEDFDGDDKDDIAVWRPGAAATFYIFNSLTSTVRVENFGQTGDNATVVDDYDGDNKADLAVYRSGASPGAQSTWFYRTTANGPTTYVPWGANGDFVSPGDYDGDGKADFVIQRNAGGGQAAFWTRLATGATSVTFFGTPTDVVVPGDWDGDGKTDIATVRGSGGAIQWFYRSSLNGSVNYITFGASATDFPTQGDYDGDGKTDAAIWRPDAAGAFWARSTGTGAISVFTLGAPGDYAVARFNTH